MDEIETTFQAAGWGGGNCSDNTGYTNTEGSYTAGLKQVPIVKLRIVRA